ncbi:MAG: hypothetical protein ACLQFR_00110 [Streptosporangiaceae bacterium]
MNQLQDLRVSVGQTWRFTTTPAGMATVAEDLSGYRQRIDGLKSMPAGPAGSGFNLPWPTYYSTLWGYLFGREYKNTRTPLLVRALLPLLSVEPARLKAVEKAAEPVPDMPFAYVQYSEAFLHPFAVTTVLHLLVGSGLPDGREASVLDGLLRLPLEGEPPRQVRDGAPLPEGLPFPAATDADGKNARFEQVSGFVSLSAIHQAAEPGPLSYRLASLYRKTATDKSRPMNTDHTAVSVTDRQVGILVPRETVRHAECLHHNITTLLACMENLAAVVVAEQVTEACDWFQRQAAVMLNHLYRRAPLPTVNGIYKSRVAEMWIQHRDLVPAINRVNGDAQPPPPALP